MRIDSILREILALAVDDVTASWSAIGIVRLYTRQKERSALKLATIDVLRLLLTEKLVVIGDLVGIGSDPDFGFRSCEFRPWSTSAEAALQRVEAVWNDPAVNPIEDTLFWLMITETGRNRLSNLSK